VNRGARGRFVYRLIQTGDGSGAEAESRQMHAGAADLPTLQGAGVVIVLTHLLRRRQDE
jgi:hypothetical protein